MAFRKCPKKGVFRASPADCAKSRLTVELQAWPRPAFGTPLAYVSQYPPPNHEGKYLAGTRAHLHAWPDQDYECYDTPYWRFMEWDGALSGTDSRGVVIMHENRWVVTYFREMFPPPCTPRP